MRLFVGLLIFLLAYGTATSQPLREKYRPQFHFTAEKNWLNDPNGLVYHAGEYHLFYQHNPFGTTQGHLSWGHAVSSDLVRWKELPVAIMEENNVEIYSGSAVMDPFNTTGFVQTRGQVPIVAVYTGNIPNTNQSQHIAYSLDSGRTFTKFNGNPVLDLDKKDFRDPKVFWHEPTKRWIMAVMLPQEKIVQFYSSKSLKAWTLLSQFGPAGDTTGIWECPDLFRVPVAGSPGRYKWVFMMSPAPYMQYFVGEFDGTRFINETKGPQVLRPDYGPDYYAGVVYNNLPGNHTPVSIAWVNNWKYANEIPAGVWRGAMSLPRHLEVKKIDNEWILLQNPVDQLEDLVAKKTTMPVKEQIPLADQDFQLEWNWQADTTIVQEFYINDREFLVRFDAASKEITIDRSRSTGFNNEAYKNLSVFKATFPGALPSSLKVRLYFDNSIAELYVGEGEIAMTAQVFLADGVRSVGFMGTAGSLTYRDFVGYREKMK
jgi:fructan beta-fructosidase